MNKDDKLFEGLDPKAADKLAADLDLAKKIEILAEAIDSKGIDFGCPECGYAYSFYWGTQPHASGCKEAK